MTDPEPITPDDFTIRQVWAHMTQKPEVALAEFDRWLEAHDAAIRKESAEFGYQRALDNAIILIATDTNPHGRYGSLNEGSRSTWFSRGLREAERRLTIMKGTK